MDRKPRKPTKIHLVVDRSLDSDNPTGIERRGKGSQQTTSRRDRRAVPEILEEPKMFKFNIKYLIIAFIVVLIGTVAFVQYGNMVECEATGGRYMKEVFRTKHECVIPAKK